MKRLKEAVILSLLISTLPSCKNAVEQSIECGSEDTKARVIDVVQKSLSTALSVNYAESKRSEILRQLIMVVDTVRTVKAEPAIHRNACEANLSVFLPERAKETLNKFDFFERGNSPVKFDGMALSLNISYISQATDDLQTQYIEVSGFDRLSMGIVALASFGAF